MKAPGSKGLALAEAFLVTFLWSTSYVLVKIGLREINPLTLVTYRYVIASLVLLLVWCSRGGLSLRRLNRRKLTSVFLLAFTGYFIAQGLQVIVLSYLPVTTNAVILNLSPIIVLTLGIVFLGERPSPAQFVGIVTALLGVLAFFSEGVSATSEVFGLALALVSGLGWATYMVLSRYYLRGGREDVLWFTTMSMALGSLMMLLPTATTGNLTGVSLGGWAIILWLSLVNTSLAFVLWNRALRVLKAYEQSVLQSSMIVQSSLLAMIFLGERLTPLMMLGMALVIVGVLIVQLRARPSTP